MLKNFFKIFQIHISCLQKTYRNYLLHSKINKILKKKFQSKLRAFIQLISRRNQGKIFFKFHAIIYKYMRIDKDNIINIIQKFIISSIKIYNYCFLFFTNYAKQNGKLYSSTRRFQNVRQ